jgi:hypothetical protein
MLDQEEGRQMGIKTRRGRGKYNHYKHMWPFDLRDENDAEGENSQRTKPGGLCYWRESEGDIFFLSGAVFRKVLLLL